MEIKCPKAVKLTKVEGHATEEKVSRGEATVEDTKGKDFADGAADKRANSADGNLMQIAETYAQKSEGYKSFMKRMQPQIDTELVHMGRSVYKK